MTGQWVSNAIDYTREYQYDKLGRFVKSVPLPGDKFYTDYQNLDQFENRQGTNLIDGASMNYIVGTRNQFAVAQGPALLGNKRGAGALVGVPTWSFINVNFQCTQSPTPDEHISDRGEAFGQRNGYEYGWSSANPNGIYNGSPDSPTPSHDSYNYLAVGSSWSFTLPNGAYFVELVAGDIYDVNSTYAVAAEGAQILYGTANSKQQFVTAMEVVVVNDGQLTLTNSGTAPAKLAYIRIGQSLSGSPTNPTMEDVFEHHPVGARAADVNFTYTWTDTDVRVNEINNKHYDENNNDNYAPESARYLYDVSGRRVAVIYSGQGASSPFKSTRLVYNGINVIEERSLNGNTLFKRFYHEGVNRPLVMEENGNQYIILTDDRGSVIGVADSTGQLLEKIYYNSHGLMKVFDGSEQPIEDANGHNVACSQIVPFGWTGYYKDKLTGFYVTMFRLFDPLHNQWLSEDPLGQLDGMGLMAMYAGVNGVDLDGLAVDTIWDLVSIIYDVGKITVGVAFDNPALVREGTVYLISDAIAFAVPGMPAGASKIRRLKWKKLKKNMYVTKLDDGTELVVKVSQRVKRAKTFCKSNKLGRELTDRLQKLAGNNLLDVDVVVKGKIGKTIYKTDFDIVLRANRKWVYELKNSAGKKKVDKYIMDEWIARYRIKEKLAKQSGAKMKGFILGKKVNMTDAAKKRLVESGIKFAREDKIKWGFQIIKRKR